MKIFSFSRWSILSVFMVGLAVMMIASCTKYPDPPPYFEKFDSTDIPLKRKVLLINVAGMSGPEIKKIQPPFIMKMLQHSKYSWKAMTDKVTTDAATWESLMTGLSVDQHQVRDSSFEIVPDEDHLEDRIPVYPTFITRLRSKAPTLDIFAASPWKRLNQKLLANADILINAADDQVVADSTMSELKNGASDLLIADFNEVNIAGKTDGFTADVPEYKAAMNKVDGYIKGMVDAIKSRPDYENEQWLVILTSTHGGQGKSYGGKTLEERTIFTAYYNPHFKELNVPGLNYTQAVSFHHNTAEIPDDSKYNFGSSGSYTVMLRVKPTSFGSHNPAILTKSDVSYGGGNTQWTMMFVGGSGRWRGYMVAGGKQFYLSAGTISLNEWHTLTLKIYTESGKRMAAVYTDGKVNNTTDITGYDFTNSKTLKIGNVPGYGGGSSTETVQDLRIWDKALPDSTIDSISCNPTAVALADYKSDLIGYWPGNDGTGLAFKDKSGSGNDFVLDHDSKWDLISAFEGCVVKKPHEEIPLLSSIRNRGIPPQIFYWLRVKISPDWGWEGNVWMDRFEKEFYKKKNTQ